MKELSINELAQYVHKCNIKWWQHPITKEPIARDPDELLMLVITELAEACEGERKNLMDDKLPHRRMAEVEMADAYIRVLDFAAGFKTGIDDFADQEFDPETCKGADLLSICYWISRYHETTDEQENIANILSYIRGYCNKYKYDLLGAVQEKLAYNATRIDHTHEARLQAGGKRW